MRRFLETGANGFIGQHLCRHLLDAGWEDKGAVRRPDAAQELPPGVMALWWATRVRKPIGVKRTDLAAGKERVFVGNLVDVNGCPWSTLCLPGPSSS